MSSQESGTGTAPETCQCWKMSCYLTLKREREEAMEATILRAARMVIRECHHCSCPIFLTCCPPVPTQTPLWLFHHCFNFWGPVGPLWNSPRHFLFMNALDPICIQVLSFVCSWMVLCSCSHSNKLRSAIGDTHCVKTKPEVSNNFVAQEFGRSFLKLLFFSPSCANDDCISQFCAEVEIPKCSWKSFTCGLWPSHRHKVLETLWEHSTQQCGKE